MHLLIDLTSILGLKDTPDALVAVSKDQWLHLRKIWPAHCYGDPDSLSDRCMYSNTPQTVSSYRVDLTGLFGLTCLKEGNLVLKDQWLAIASNPELRPYCKGGESKGVLDKKPNRAERPE